MRRIIALSLILLFISIGLCPSSLSEPSLMISFILMGGAMSSASVIVYYRRLEFLVAEAVHASLFSVIAGLVMEFFTGINYLAFSVAIGLFTIYATGYLIKTGIPPRESNCYSCSAHVGASGVNNALHYY